MITHIIIIIIITHTHSRVVQCCSSTTFNRPAQQWLLPIPLPCGQYDENSEKPRDRELPPPPITYLSVTILTPILYICTLSCSTKHNKEKLT